MVQSSMKEQRGRETGRDVHVYVYESKSYNKGIELPENETYHSKLYKLTSRCT